MSDEFSYYPAEAYRNSGFGVPPSPYYNAVKGNDFMSRAGGYQFQSAFANPLELPGMSPLMQLGTMMAGAYVMGGDLYNIRPMQQPQMPALDYITARARTLEGGAARKTVLANSFPYLESRIGAGAASTEFAQEAYDFLSGRSQAFNTLYGGIGGYLTGGGGRAEQSLAAFSQMEGAFVRDIMGDPRNGSFDRNKSYGFSMPELVSQVETSLRYGIGGVTKSSINRSINDPENNFGSLVQGNAEMYNSARQVFGMDKSMEELAQLMTSSIDGIQGMDSSKASTLLNKIQAVSRSVNISSQALLEYMKMINSVSESVGMSGLDATGLALSSIGTVSAVTNLGRTNGDTLLSNQSANAVAMAENQSDFIGSPMMKRVAGLLSITQGLSGESLSAIKIDGVGTMADVLAKDGALMKALKSGDTATAQKIMDNVVKGVQDNPYGISGASIVRKGNDLSSQDIERFESVIPASELKSGQRERLIDRLSGALAENTGLEKSTLGKIIGSVGSLGELQTPDAVLQAIEEAGGLGIDPSQRRVIADQIAAGTRQVGSGVYAQLGYARKGDTTDQTMRRASIALASGSEKVQKAAEESKRGADIGFIQQQIVSQISGEALGGITGTDMAELMLGIVKDFNEGEVSIEKLIEDPKKYLNKYVKEGMMSVTQMKGLSSALSEGSVEGILNEANSAYDKAISEGKTEQEATAIKEGVMKNRATAFGKNVLNSAMSEAGQAPTPPLPGGSGSKPSTSESDRESDTTSEAIAKNTGETNVLLGKLLVAVSGKTVPLSSDLNSIKMLET